MRCKGNPWPAQPSGRGDDFDFHQPVAHQGLRDNGSGRDRPPAEGGNACGGIGFGIGWVGEVAGETDDVVDRSEEHTSELQSLMRISYAVFCLKKKTTPSYKR